MRGEVQLGIIALIIAIAVFFGSLIAMLAAVYIVKFREPVFQGSFFQIAYKSLLLAAFATVATYIFSYMYIGFFIDNGRELGNYNYQETIIHDQLKETLNQTAFAFFIEISMLLIMPNLVGFVGRKFDKITNIKITMFLNMSVIIYFNRKLHEIITGYYEFTPSYFGFSGNFFFVFQIAEIIYLMALVYVIFSGSDKWIRDLQDKVEAKYPILKL